MTTSVRDTVRVFNKYLLNPAMLRLAGRKHWMRGRFGTPGAGRGRATPRRSLPTGVADGFIVPLPYRTHVDWLRNVLASDRATIRVGGQTYDVAHPKVIDTVSAAPQLPLGHRRTFQRLGIDDFMKIELAPTAHNDR